MDMGGLCWIQITILPLVGTLGRCTGCGGISKSAETGVSHIGRNIGIIGNLNISTSKLVWNSGPSHIQLSSTDEAMPMGYVLHLVVGGSYRRILKLRECLLPYHGATLQITSPGKLDRIGTSIRFCA